jgi:hypothetical protein
MSIFCVCVSDLELLVVGIHLIMNLVLPMSLDDSGNCAKSVTSNHLSYPAIFLFVMIILSSGAFHFLSLRSRSPQLPR